MWNSSLFEAGHEITREQIIDALPIDHSGLSTPVPSQQPHDYETERKMLWQLVLSLKSEIEQLRQRMDAGDTRDHTGERCDVPSITSLVKYPSLTSSV